MNLTQAQPSAFAKSQGAYLSVIESIAENVENNFEMQGNALLTSSKMTGAEATATRDGMNAQADAESDQATGLLAAGLGTALAGGVSMGDEFTTCFGEHGTNALNGKIENLEENEKMMAKLGAPQVRAESVVSGQQAKIEDAKTTAAKGRITTAAQADAKMNEKDLEAAKTDASFYDRTSERVKARKKTLVDKRDDIQESVSARRATFQLLGQGVGQTVQAFNNTAAADQRRVQGAHQLEQTLYKYIGDTSNKMSDMDGQVSQTLTGARDSAYQNLEAIVRSNQPN